jgi:hypothetical protein
MSGGGKRGGASASVLAPILDSTNYILRPAIIFGMDTGEQLAGYLIDTITSGRDIWVFDQILQGPDRLEHARKILFERRAACSDPDEVALLTSIISGLDKSAP